MVTLFETTTHDGKREHARAMVRGKNAHGEYVVSLYERGRADALYENKNARYFTNDLHDACATACAMVEHAEARAD